MTMLAQKVSMYPSPADIFNGSVDGVWYDPSDLTTLFQDAAGTIPVAADGDPIGLMLDKSKGLVRGPELVTNGTFDSGTTGWTASAGTIAAVSGEMEVTNSGVSYGTGYQSLATVAGQTYKVTLTAYAGTATTVFIAAKNALLTNPDLAVTSTTSKTSVPLSFIFTATGTNTLIVCVNSNQGNATGYFDNISVCELGGYHATQTSAGNRPVYKTDGHLHWVECTAASSQFMTHNANAPGTGEFLGVYAYESANSSVVPFLAFGSGLSTSYTGVSFRVGSGYQIQITGADTTSSGGLVSFGIGAGKRLISATRTVQYAGGSPVPIFQNDLGTLNLTNTNKRLFCFYTFTNQAFMNGKFFGGVYIRGATTPQQRQLIQEYLARKSNIAVANSASSWSVINPIIQKVTL